MFDEIRTLRQTVSRAKKDGRYRELLVNPDVDIQPLEGDEFGWLFDQGCFVAKSIGVTVETTVDMPSDVWGQWHADERRITVRPASPNQMTSVLLHELVHATSWKSNKYYWADPYREETITEAAACIVAALFGFDKTTLTVPLLLRFTHNSNCFYLHDRLVEDDIVLAVWTLEDHFNALEDTAAG